ncbi:MAG TPA: glycoside hydrolase family 76 protein [Verrucomicrobiae bacterium]|nr:glycoside hydrolase family 76 protein [Verrucomicrobiae bacterium]
MKRNNDMETGSPAWSSPSSRERKVPGIGSKILPYGEIVGMLRLVLNSEETLPQYLRQMTRGFAHRIGGEVSRQVNLRFAPPGARLRPLLAALLPALLLFATVKPAAAYLSTDVDTIARGYTNAFYLVSRTNGYFRTVQNSSGHTYFWQAANEIQSVEDAYKWTANPVYLRMITNLLNGFLTDNGANWANNGYNDDDLWAVMAFAMGGQLTGKTNYYAVAKANFDMVYARGWDTKLGGGLYWQYPNNASKNACVNGPGAIAAGLLYQYYGDTNYWVKATNIYAWERAALYNPSTGRVYDNISTNGTVSQTPTTYNQGTFIGAADFLNQTNDALLAATYTMNSMGGAGFMPQYGIGGNNSIFNSIFIRWMARFMKNRGIQAPYQAWLQNEANAAWNGRRSTDNLSWCQWPQATPPGTNFYSYDCVSSFEAMLAVPPTQTNAATAVSLLATDAAGASSFEGGLNWADATAPSVAHDYTVNGLTLRTPPDGVSHFFSGNSLTLSNGAILGCKNTAGGIGIAVGTDLFLDNGQVADWAGNSTTFYGKVTLLSGGGILDPQLNTFTITALIGGTGFLRVQATTLAQAGGKLIFSAPNTYTGGTIINAAHTLQLSGQGTLGAATASLTFSNTAGFGYGMVDLNGLNLGVGGLSGPAGRIFNNSTTPAVLTVGNGNASGNIFQGTLTGNIKLVKTGTGTQVLANANTYTNITIIGAGTLALRGSGGMSSSAQIIVSNAAIFDVSGRADQTFTANNNQIFRGGGTVLGKLTAQAGSTVIPGDAIGTLTVQSNVNLGGTLLMEINRGATPANDRLISLSGTIAGGGTLTVSNAGPALQGGDVFSLFNQPVSGFSTVNLPVLPVGYGWRNNLAVDGTVRVVSTNATAIGMAVSSENEMTLTWPADHAGWRLQAQTNGFAPENWFDISGATATNQLIIPVDPASGSVFFRLVYP